MKKTAPSGTPADTINDQEIMICAMLDKLNADAATSSTTEGDERVQCLKEIQVQFEVIDRARTRWGWQDAWFESEIRARFDLSAWYDWYLKN
jgi:hypothetical protein